MNNLTFAEGEDIKSDESIFNWSKFKVELNNVVMCYGPPDVTIAQAEEAMLLLIGELNKCHMANSEIFKGK